MPPPADNSPAEPANPSRLRLLLAEDYKDFGDALQRKIERDLKPFLDIVEVVRTETLEEALILSQTCDVSIIDRQLKGTTSEATDAAIHRFRKPVIILTAHWTPEIETRCLTAGAHAVFDKMKWERLMEALLLAAVHGLSASITHEPTVAA